MPKRVLDFDALWASDKIASCPAWAQAEYAWLYGLADASGSFELTNLRVIWGRVAAVRKDLTIERLAEIFQEFMARGLLFAWESGGKRYGHWTGSDVPGRLPAPSWRARLERLAPPVPKRELAAYMSRFSSRREAPVGDEAAEEAQPTLFDRERVQSESSAIDSDLPRPKTAEQGELKAGLEAAQGQEWDRDWKKEEEREDTPACASPVLSSEYATAELCAEDLLEIYEWERGSLPAAAGLTLERRRQCRQRIRGRLTREEFALAVRRAAATPFLIGDGARGWRASFDWLMANDTNWRKVIEGAYESVQPRSGARPMDRALHSEIYAGAGPVAADYGVRARPEAIERMRAREAARGSP